jgi:transformation/transcription domain-associated protein
VHHVRGDLSANQLARVAKLYSALIHNPYLGHNLHTLFSKMMFGLIENITTKDTPQGAARVLTAMFETCVNKVEAMTLVLDNAFERMEKGKNGEGQGIDLVLIEKARPVAGAAYATEKPEEVIHGMNTFGLHGLTFDAVDYRMPLSLPDSPSWFPCLPSGIEEM